MEEFDQVYILQGLAQPNSWEDFHHLGCFQDQCFAFVPTLIFISTVNRSLLLSFLHLLLGSKANNWELRTV